MTKKQRAVVAKRLRRMNRAFVASTTLRPMAQQLLETRTRAAYNGVEVYARRHAGTDAGAMAYLVLGYAHVLDRDYTQAIPPLKKSHVADGELADYTDYFLASAYQATSQPDQTVAILKSFETNHGDSLFLRDAMVVYANALTATDRPQEAIEILNRYRETERADVYLALGKAYLKAGDSPKAAELLRRVYFNMPLASEAAEAKVDLDSLASAGSIPAPTFADRKTRADVLASARRWSDAAREYRLLLNDAQDSNRLSVQAALGMALHRSGNDREAREVFDSMPDSADPANAQRLLALLEMARSGGDEVRFRDLTERLRQNFATSPYFEEALLQGGNMYLLKADYDRAIDYYRELQQRFPSAKRASYAHWKAAWLSLRQKRTEEAKKLFEEQVDWYPASPEVPAALYWRARLAEEDRDFGKARAWYQKLADSFHNYYYSDLSRDRLTQIPVSAANDPDPILQKVAAPVAPSKLAADGEPGDDLRAEKARLLENAGMMDYCVRELRAAAADGETGWATREIARLYRDTGRYDRALQTLKRAVPSYYSLDFDALPRDTWEALFPRPYWADLRRYAAENGLDPFLVASLIRQESEFNPGAVSNANALGLMQLLPNTGRSMARVLRVRFQTESLMSPTINMRLGTRYFKELVDRYNGRFEYALAAYNAGADRVDTWLAAGNYRDVPEFVESIPFTETREYVQAIVRNASVYRKLYKTP
jgi:soluble lytic murein transglycosylase